MEKFREIGVEIFEFVFAGHEALIRRGEGRRFIVCGSSGSGKTRAITFANYLLDEDQQVAESQDLRSMKEPEKAKALNIMYDPDLAYEASRHIGFNLFSRELASALEEQGVQVFWLDSGVPSKP